MAPLCRLALGSVFVLGATRMIAFLVYATILIPSEFETFNLEGKMVLLADRAMAGASLYPAWEHYPHVANFFGPLYFLLVGLVGRASGTDLHGLFLIGRGVTLASALGTSVVVAVYLKRRYGMGAAVMGAVLSLGTAPMYGFSVMARPDLMAEFLGVLGFFVSGLRPRAAWLAGCLMLVAAVMTKQTSFVFLLAGAGALFFEGERKRGLLMLGGCALAIVAIIAAVTLWLEPRFARDLFGESRTAWESLTWLRTLVRAFLWSPDQFFFAVVGLGLWSTRRYRNARLIVLTLAIAAVSLATSAKRGADLNYFLSFRVIEALAAGTLWHVALASATDEGRAGAIVTAFLALASLWPSTGTAIELGKLAWKSKSLVHNPMGPADSRALRQLVQVAGDPKYHMLSDAGLLDVYQRDRAVFGDPWLFHLLAETGQVDLDVLKHRIEAKYYDLIVTSNDISRPEYAVYDFGLPKVLVDLILKHYTPRESQPGLYIYRRREESAR